MSLYSKAHPRVCDNCTEVLRLLPARQKPFRDVKSVLFVQTTPQWCTKPRSSGTRRRDLDPPRQVLVKGSLARGPRRRHRPQFPPALAGFTTAGPRPLAPNPPIYFFQTCPPKPTVSSSSPRSNHSQLTLGKCLQAQPLLSHLLLAPQTVTPCKWLFVKVTHNLRRAECSV